jgi:hypothetical protein
MHFPTGQSRFFSPILFCALACMACASSAAADRPQQKSAAHASAQPAAGQGEIIIPGPLKPFLRMAAISQQVSPEEVLPLLARNIVINGYRGAPDRSPKPTEFLTLLKRYLQMANQLRLRAGAAEAITVSNCQEAEQLLTSIGYRLKQGCGPNAEIEAADGDRAFIANDSGFPIVDLEEALRENKPFVYAYHSSRVPMIFTVDDWKLIQTGNDASESLIDALIEDPVEARLYWALARMDSETREFLRKSPGLPKLIANEGLLDFYGANLLIHSGRVLVPGGPIAEPAWKQLVGASPESPEEFVTKLLSRDEGWLAAYFDALSRLNETQLAYFTDAHRLSSFYQALRGSDPHPGPAKFLVFRPNAGLSLLTERLQFDSKDSPLIPGNVQVWKDIVRHKPASKIASEWAHKAGGWNSPEQVVQGMFGLSRADNNSGPLQMFLTLSEIDRERPRDWRISPQTARLLADNYAKFNNQYLIFSEFHDLNDESIARFLAVAQELDRIGDRSVRANAIGTFQAEIGIWEILARQGQISASSLNASWQGVLTPFFHISSSAQVFDAGRSALTELVRSVTGETGFSENGLITLLAGPDQSTPDGRQVRQLLANRIRAVMESQRLASLDTLFQLGDGLHSLSEGKANTEALVPLANELREFEMPRTMFTNTERNAWAGGLYDNRHKELKTGRDLVQIIQSPRSSQEVSDARGQLAPFIRDTLVGLNYAYYEPPGAQMLHNNPLFVRYHDFAGAGIVAGDPAWHTPMVLGRGWAAGGGAHLVGSLADLPYVLAETEQDFIVPENVQALVWEDLVPSLLISAVLPRWWHVTPTELHAVALYQRAGEELVAQAATNAQLRQQVLDILSDRLLPQTREIVENGLREGHSDAALAQITPAATAYVTVQFRRRFPGENNYWGEAGRELQALAARNSEEVSWQRISEDFGVPHPALAQTYSRELLNVKPFPAILGYSSRLMAESWESNNLYWARLADELGYSPVMLNRLVPELTHRMIEKIFATYFEDWEAVLRAMRETGDEFRQGKVAPLPKSTVASGF